MHQPRWSLPHPLDRKQRNVLIVEGEGRLVKGKISVDTRAHDQSANKGRGQQQNVQPPTLARRPGNPDLRLNLLLPFKGGRSGGRGFGHRKRRSKVRGQIAGINPCSGLFTSAIWSLTSDLARAASQSIAVPCPV